MNYRCKYLASTCVKKIKEGNLIEVGKKIAKEELSFTLRRTAQIWVNWSCVLVMFCSWVALRLTTLLLIRCGGFDGFIALPDSKYQIRLDQQLALVQLTWTLWVCANCFAVQPSLSTTDLSASHCTNTPTSDATWPTTRISTSCPQAGASPHSLQPNAD